MLRVFGATNYKKNDNNITRTCHWVFFNDFSVSDTTPGKSSNIYIFISGCVAVINDSNDPNAQQFLRGHDDSLTCLAISNNGQVIATGQKGENADCCLWDSQTLKLAHRLAEHEQSVGACAFSHDDVSFLTLQ